MNHSSIITTKGVWTVDGEKKDALYRHLLQPFPDPFVLILHTGEVGTHVHLHLAHVNNPTTEDKTNRSFTLGNILHHYSPYELKAALSNGESEGKEPGVAALIKFLGPYQLPEPFVQNQPGNRGRPNKHQRKTT